MLKYIHQHSFTNIPGDSIRYRIRWDAIQNRSESSQNPMIRQKSDRNPGDDPTDGSVVLDPIGSYSRIRYFYRSIVF
jgi:hypothetical protein